MVYRECCACLKKGVRSSKSEGEATSTCGARRRGIGNRFYRRQSRIFLSITRFNILRHQRKVVGDQSARCGETVRQFTQEDLSRAVANIWRSRMSKRSLKERNYHFNCQKNEGRRLTHPAEASINARARDLYATQKLQ